MLPVALGALSQNEKSTFHAQAPTHCAESKVDQHCAAPVGPPGVVRTVVPPVGVLPKPALSQKKKSTFHAHAPMHCVEFKMDQHCTCVVVAPPPPVVVPPDEPVTTGLVVDPPGVVVTSSQKKKSAFHAQLPTHCVESMIDQHCAAPVVDPLEAVVDPLEAVVETPPPPGASSQANTIGFHRHVPTQSISAVIVKQSTCRRERRWSGRARRYLASARVRVSVGERM